MPGACCSWLPLNRWVIPLWFGELLAGSGFPSRRRRSSQWDTASAFSDPVLHLLRSVTGLENVVFGTDYPYPHDDISIAGLRQLQNTAELDGGARGGVLGGSAARLIPRLAGVEHRRFPCDH